MRKFFKYTDWNKVASMFGALACGIIIGIIGLGVFVLNTANKFSCKQNYRNTIKFQNSKENPHTSLKKVNQLLIEARKFSCNEERAHCILARLKLTIAKEFSKEKNISKAKFFAHSAIQNARMCANELNTSYTNKIRKEAEKILKP